jgi:hypothetical protein
MSGDRDPLSRRELLIGAAGAAAAGLAAGCEAPADGARTAPGPAPSERPNPARPATGMRLRPLGRTGLEVSEVGFGGLPVDDPEVLRYAVDRGVNYVDTSPCYRRGASEETIGRALAGAWRDRVVLVTKWCPHHEGRPARTSEFLAQLDRSLARLGTDHVDVVLNHEVGKSSDGRGVERLRDPEMLEAFARAKAAGKVRFLGASGHDGDLPGVMGYAVDSGAFDVLLCRYSFLDYPDQQRLIERAHAAGVGFVAMKTLAGAKGADLDAFRAGGATFKQAALKWVLANPKLSNLVISISSRKQVDEYVAASGAPLADEDVALLDEYSRRHSREVCRFCNACEPACPGDVRVADALRFSMYFHEYGEVERARAAYAALAGAGDASACAPCAAPCVAACPHGLAVRDLLLRAHGALTSAI